LRTRRAIDNEENNPQLSIKKNELLQASPSLVTAALLTINH
jgi:hypothetical protein